MLSIRCFGVFAMHDEATGTPSGKKHSGNLCCRWPVQYAQLEVRSTSLQYDMTLAVLCCNSTQQPATTTIQPGNGITCPGSTVHLTSQRKSTLGSPSGETLRQKIWNGSEVGTLTACRMWRIRGSVVARRQTPRWKGFHTPRVDR